MTALALFASTFVLVFALGFQSLNVNNNHYLAAAITSFVIGSMQMIVLKLAPDASAIEIAAFIGGGPLGIVCSMWAHKRTLGRETPRECILRLLSNGAEWFGLDLIEQSNGVLKRGTLYVHLNRLENEGLISSRKRRETSIAGMPVRRLYTIVAP